MTQKEKETIEKISDEAELDVDSKFGKKDMKERRGLTKVTLYDGSKKLKHSVPKGKKI
ncbi:MAG: hypothetical protein HYS23_09700 [Geobacter sp.]|nr:hypothetical protein [Geobacter sp.]